MGSEILDEQKKYEEHTTETLITLERDGDLKAKEELGLRAAKGDDVAVRYLSLKAMNTADLIAYAETIHKNAYECIQYRDKQPKLYEDELAIRAKNNDIKALNFLLNKEIIEQRINSRSWRNNILNNPQCIEDIGTQVQESITKSIKNFKIMKFNSFYHWSNRIIINKIISHVTDVRHCDRHIPLPDPDGRNDDKTCPDIEVISPDIEAINKEQYNSGIEIFESILVNIEIYDKKSVLIFLLRTLFGFEFDDIAKIFGYKGKTGPHHKYKRFLVKIKSLYKGGGGVKDEVYRYLHFFCECVEGLSKKEMIVVVLKWFYPLPVSKISEILKVNDDKITCNIIIEMTPRVNKCLECKGINLKIFSQSVKKYMN